MSSHEILPACAICDNPLTTSFPEGNCFPAPPDGAVIFRAKGNYGSAVYDPQAPARSLLIHVCDECLVGLREKGAVLELTTWQKPVHHVRLWTEEEDEHAPGSADASPAAGEQPAS